MARLLVLLIVGVVVTRSAWVCDDAFITLRMLDNLFSGHGLTYNPAERVQAFTHPGWALWLAIPYAITREPWLTTMAVSGVTTLGAMIALLHLHATKKLAPFTVGAALVSSKAWVDYATSGLEAPLLWLLLAGFAHDVLRRGPLWRVVGLAALIGLTRLDALLLVAPAVAWATSRAAARHRWRAQLAWAPLAGWLAGATLYYGTPWPNPAFAKLGAGVSHLALAGQALHYAAWTLWNDPTTLLLLAGGLTSTAIRPTRGRTALAAGIAAYLLYLLWIGGDFMGGRFFAAPLWMSILLLARAPLRLRHHRGLTVGSILVSLVSPYAPLRSGPGYTKAPAAHGVVDERGYYWDGTGLVTTAGSRTEPTHEFVRAGRAARHHPIHGGVVVKSTIGLYGYYAGSNVHIVDRLGLADPFLARQPLPEGATWRIGHFRRAIPAGYLESLRRDDNLVEDPALAAEYARVRRLTRAPVFDGTRLWTVLTSAGR